MQLDWPSQLGPSADSNLPSAFIHGPTRAYYLTNQKTMTETKTKRNEDDKEKTAQILICRVPLFSDLLMHIGPKDYLR